MGNVRGNAFWEGRLPKDFRRPLEADMAALRVFITDKYVNRKYCLQGYNEPPGIENYESHPVSRSGQILSYIKLFFSVCGRVHWMPAAGCTAVV